MITEIKRLRPTLGLAALAALCLLLGASAGHAAGSAPTTPTVPSKPETLEENAEKHYNQGLEHRDKAWKLEKEAAAAEAGSARTEKLMKKALKEYEKAVKSQRNAVTANPRMYQAYSSLGYALRKTGDFEASLEAYDTALELEPGYTEAIEYRAEAYLALGRLEEAKAAYLTLLRSDQARADELMSAMKQWIELNQDGSSAVSDADREEFTTWVEERAEVASQTSMLGLVQPARAW